VAARRLVVFLRLPHAEIGLARQEKRQADRKRHEEIHDAKGNERANRACPRQDIEDRGFQHAQSAGHMADQRRQIAGDISACDREIGGFSEGRQQLMQACRDTGEIDRAEDDLSKRDLPHGQIDIPLPKTHRAA